MQSRSRHFHNTQQRPEPSQADPVFDYKTLNPPNAQLQNVMDQLDSPIHKFARKRIKSFVDKTPNLKQDPSHTVDPVSGSSSPLTMQHIVQLRKVLGESGFSNKNQQSSKKVRLQPMATATPKKEPMKWEENNFNYSMPQTATDGDYGSQVAAVADSLQGPLTNLDAFRHFFKKKRSIGIEKARSDSKTRYLFHMKRNTQSSECPSSRLSNHVAKQCQQHLESLKHTPKLIYQNTERQPDKEMVACTNFASITQALNGRDVPFGAFPSSKVKDIYDKYVTNNSTKNEMKLLAKMSDVRRTEQPKNTFDSKMERRNHTKDMVRTGILKSEQVKMFEDNNRVAIQHIQQKTNQNTASTNTLLNEHTQVTTEADEDSVFSTVDNTYKGRGFVSIQKFSSQLHNTESGSVPLNGQYKIGTEGSPVSTMRSFTRALDSSLGHNMIEFKKNSRGEHPETSKARRIHKILPSIQNMAIQDCSKINKQNLGHIQRAMIDKVSGIIENITVSKCESRRTKANSVICSSNDAYHPPLDHNLLYRELEVLVAHQKNSEHYNEYNTCVNELVHVHKERAKSKKYIVTSPNSRYQTNEVVGELPQILPNLRSPIASQHAVENSAMKQLSAVNSAESPPNASPDVFSKREHLSEEEEDCSQSRGWINSENLSSPAPRIRRFTSAQKKDTNSSDLGKTSSINLSKRLSVVKRKQKITQENQHELPECHIVKLVQEYCNQPTQQTINPRKKNKVITGADFVQILKDDLDKHESEVQQKAEEAKRIAAELIYKRKASIIGGLNDQPWQKDAVKGWYREFLIKLRLKKDVKVRIEKSDLKEMLKPFTQSERARIKINTRDGIEELLPSKYEIQIPETQQALIHNLDGRLVVSKDGYNLLKMLVDQYHAEDSKIHQRLIRFMRNCFLKKLEYGLGAKKFQKLNKPKQVPLEAKPVDWELNSQFSQISSDHEDQQIDYKDIESMLEDVEKEDQFRQDTVTSPNPFSEPINSANTRESHANSGDLERVLSQGSLEGVTGEHPILTKEAEKYAYYNLVKKVLNKTGALNEELQSANPNPKLKFFDECMKNQVATEPIFLNLSDKTFTLLDQGLTMGAAKALHAYFKASSENITELILDRNGLKDESFNLILNAMGEKSLTKLNYQNNELGEKSLQTIIAQFATDMKVYRLSNVHIEPWIAQKYGLGFDSSTRLEKLSLVGMNLSQPSVYTRLCEYLGQPLKKLKLLELAWASLKDTQISEVLDLLIEFQSKKLQDLNLSNNQLDPSRVAVFRQIIDKIKMFIKKSKTLVHLDLSGMFLGQACLEIFDEVKKSKTLNCVHFSNNSIPNDIQELMCQILRQNFEEIENGQLKKHYRLKDSEKEQLRTSAQSVIVNHSLLRTMQAQNMLQRMEKDADVQQTSNLLMCRYLNNPELDYSQQNSIQSVAHGRKAQLLPDNWQLSMNPSCWMCQGQNYVVIFYSPSQGEEWMQKLAQNSPDSQTLKKQVFKDLPISFNYQPFLSGSLVNWKMHKMLPFQDFHKRIQDQLEEQGLLPNKKTSQKVKQAPKRKMSRVATVTSNQVAALLDQIKKFIPNAENCTLINWTNLLECKQLDENDLFVWAGFVTPGKHQMAILGKDTNFYVKSFGVLVKPLSMKRVKTISSSHDDPINEEMEIIEEKREITPEQKALFEGNLSDYDEDEQFENTSPKKWPENVKNRLQRLFKDSKFAFSNWQVQNAVLRDLVIKEDAKFSHIREFLCDVSPQEVKSVIYVVRKYFFPMNEVFIERCSRSPEYPGIDYDGTLNMIKEWYGHLQIEESHIQEIFELANVSDIEEAVSTKKIPVAALTLYAISKQNQLQDYSDTDSDFFDFSTDEEDALDRQLSLAGTDSPLKIARSQTLTRGVSFRTDTLSKALIFKYEQEEQGKKELQAVHADNLATQLRRYEFYDFMVLLAKGIAQEQNFQDPAVAKTLRKMVKDYLPKNQFIMRGEPFRINCLWTQEISEFFYENNEYFVLLFHKTSEACEWKQYFTMNSAEAFMAKIAETPIPEILGFFGCEHTTGEQASFLYDKIHVQYLFSMSKQTVIDDNLNNDAYYALELLEFFEFFARFSLLLRIKDLKQVEPKRDEPSDQQSENQEEEEKQPEDPYTTYSLDYLGRKLPEGVLFKNCSALNPRPKDLLRCLHVLLEATKIQYSGHITV